MSLAAIWSLDRPVLQHIGLLWAATHRS